jgi:uncharacterized protein YjbI with pentapeptide repeats
MSSEKNTLTGSEFLEVLIQGYTHKLNTDRRFSDFRIANNEFYIKDVYVNSAVNIFNHNLLQDKITFENIEFEEFIIGRTSFSKTLLFTNCIFRKKTNIEADFQIGISFINCVFSEDCSMRSLAQRLLIIEGCTFNKDLGFFGQGFTEVRLKKNSFTKVAVNCPTNSLIFASNRIEQLIFNNTDIHELTMSEDIISDLALTRGAFTHITISGIEINGIFEISPREILYAIIENLTGPGTIKVNPNTVKRILIQHSFFDHLYLHGEVRSDYTFSFESSEVKHLSFIDLKNNGTNKFIEIQIPQTGRLSMVNSDLGKTNFLRCNFQNCDFEFENSKVPEIFLAETDFPKKVYIGTKLNYHQAQLVFGQLQNTYQKQGDNIRANEYLSRETESHYNTLTWFEKRIFFKFNSVFRSLPWFNKKVFTKFSLFLNKLSNDFGRNWSRGVLFTFGTGFIFFYFLLLSSREYYFSFSASFDEKLVEPFLKFMNPLRHFDTQSLFGNDINLTLGSSSYIIDFLARVFIAYGFYQTIQAFRRYGKK